MVWRSGEGETTADSNTIMSPFHPNPYPTNVFCRYTLVAQPHERVQLVFADFDLNYPHGNPKDPYRYNLTCTPASVRLTPARYRHALRSEHYIASMWNTLPGSLKSKRSALIFLSASVILLQCRENGPVIVYMRNAMKFPKISYFAMVREGDK